MRLLVLGCNGQLGRDMMRSAAAAGHTVDGLDIPDIDITVYNSSIEHIRSAQPEVIVNCAGYTAVDDCEKYPDRAFAVNAEGVSVIARCAKEVHARLIHIGTDYVFDGRKKTPYIETDPTNPQSVYGKSKLQGEINLRQTWDNHCILRIAWLYGAFGANFVKTIIRLARNNKKEGAPLKVVNDQFGSPTWTIDVCNQIAVLLESEETGIFHSTSEGFCSWYDFAAAIVKNSGIGCEVVPCTTSEFPRPAPRPAYSVLENARLKQLGINRMPDWERAFEIFWNLNKESLLRE